MTEDDLKSLPIQYHFRLGRLLTLILYGVDGVVVRVAISTTGDPLVIATVFHNNRTISTQRILTMDEMTADVNNIEELWADKIVKELKDGIRGKRD